MEDILLYSILVLNKMIEDKDFKSYAIYGLSALNYHCPTIPSDRLDVIIEDKGNEILLKNKYYYYFSCNPIQQPDILEPNFLESEGLFLNDAFKTAENIEEVNARVVRLEYLLAYYLKRKGKKDWEYFSKALIALAYPISLFGEFLEKYQMKKHFLKAKRELWVRGLLSNIKK